MIRFIYFDLGGVVVRDFSASNKWDLIRKDLGISEEDAESFQTFWRVHEREICTTTTLDAMVPILERECHATIPKDYPLLGNFVKYFDKNESIWEVLQEIKEHKKIGLLTSMYVGMFDAISAKEILPNIAWDIIVDSSIVGY